MTIKKITEMIKLVGSGTPLYVQVADALRNRIIAGDLKPGDKLPPEAELATLLNINHLTLRKSLQILSGQKLISQRQGRGTFVAYSPARLFRVGIISDSFSPEKNDLYTLRLVAALNRQLNLIGGGEIVLMECSRPESSIILDKVNQTQCDGLIAINNSGLLAAALCENCFDFIPMVFINSSQPCVREAGRHEVRLAAGAIKAGLDYLIGLGHRKIAYVSADVTENPTLRMRNAEFLENQPEEAMALIAPNGSFWYDSARAMVYDLCRSANPPTAILCPGITFAAGAWLGAAEAGKRFPADLSFVGLDAEVNTNPYMTSLEQPFDEIAAKALELIRDMRLAGKHLTQLVYEFEAKLCERGSCRRHESGGVR